ncbi:MAG TPA: hypothetical protein VFV72_01120 [Candidatus Limnocylindrales bacterium]|nr:hypothetical protein [Candidatus Limnocylindrales bacterium]
MTQSREIEGVLDRWLADGPRELSDRALGEALSQIDNTRQLGAHVVPWRFSEMPTPVRLLLVAALMAVSAGAALLLSAGMRNDAPDVSPSPAPSASPLFLGAGEPVDSVTNGWWIATRRDVFGMSGEFRLEIPDPATNLFAHSSDDTVLHLGPITPDGANATALGATGTCPTIGKYTHELSPDGNVFTITAVTDSCADRSKLLAGSWHRYSTNRSTMPGRRYQLNGGWADVDITMPASYISTSGGATTFDGMADPTWVGYFRNGDLAFAIDTDAASDAMPTNRCDSASPREPFPSSLDDYVAEARATEGVDVSEPVDLKIDGYPAVRIDLTATDGCQPDTGPIGPLYMVQGMQVREWAIDVDGQLVIALIVDEDPMELLTPEVTAVGQEFIDSMEITPKP